MYEVDPREGFRFRDGRLLIFQRDKILSLGAWPELEAQSRSRIATRWTRFWPEFRVLAPRRASTRRTSRKPLQYEFDFGLELLTIAEERKSAFDAFRETFPPEIAAVVARMPEAHWAVLHLVRKSPASRDLLPENPALALALAETFVDPAKPSRPLGPFETLRQRRLAGAAGFPASDAAVRALRKVRPEAASQDAVRYLRSALRDSKSAKLIAHQPELNTGVLALLADPDLRDAATPNLLQEVALRQSERCNAPTAALLFETLELGRLLEPDRERSFRSVEQLRRTHQRLTTALAEGGTAIRNRVFGAPPVPGLPGEIVPLRSVLELEREGLRQRNCVASYATRVLRGDTYIYRVEKPERATLSLERSSSGGWSIGELKGPRNEKVSAATVAAVERWIALYAYQRRAS